MIRQTFYLTPKDPTNGSHERRGLSRETFLAWNLLQRKASEIEYADLTPQ